MKKRIGLKYFIPMIIALIVVIPMLVSGKDYGAEYDKIFGKEEGFTIHTNEFVGVEEISDYQLVDALQKFISGYATNTLYDEDEAYYYRPLIYECSASEMTCDFIVQKVIDKGNWNYDYQDFKKYDDVKINVNSDVMNYFGTVLNSNGDMIINYDESMFANDDEKYAYINQYVNSKQFINSDGYNVSFYYEVYSNTVSYTINDYSRSDFTTLFTAKSKVKSIQFNSNEIPYTENYKKLTTDGTLTIKTNTAINNGIVTEYLNHLHYNSGASSLHFSLDGNVVNGKAYVKMIQYSTSGQEEWTENHLITFIQDDKIDKNVFNMINMKDVVEISADRPESEIGSYVNYFFNGMHYKQVNLDDTAYYSFNYVSGNSGDDLSNVVSFVIYDNGNVVDIQFNEISFNFSGYSDVYSDKYATKYKNGVVVRADELDFWTVNNNLEYGYTVLSCNSDVSVCDIALSHDEEKKMEIHKVNVSLDNSISDNFKKMFNLNDDGTLDIVTDIDLDGLPYTSYYVYDEKSGASLNYSFEGNKIRLELNPYNSGDYERHSVIYKKINNGVTDFYKNNVYMSKDFYPGENENIWNNISYNYYFSKRSHGNINANTIGCNRNTGKCKVIILNSDKKLEIHEVTANIKEGKSPDFAKAFPNDSVVFNAIYKDDEQYLYGASTAYFMSKTKDYVYLHGFTKDTAMVTYNELEVHSFDVDYVEENEKYAEEVAEAKKKLKNADLTTIRSDLEFVNKFYYGSDNFFASDNFNSKTLNENFNNAVKNKHIGYFVVPEGGGGMPFMDGAMGRLVLFYDGIAYDVLDKNVDFTNYNIIYVPSNTKATPEEYVKAAQKRVDEYLGKDSGVVISYDGPIEEGIFENDDTYDMFGINKNTFDHNQYQIAYQNKTQIMLIVADSSKMQKPDFAASDVTNNISVTSDTVNYPSNTVVMSDVIDDKDSEYSKILEKAKIKNAHIVDINLYSSSVGDIDEFDGAEFNVSVPVDDEDLHDKELVAYYIDDEGNVEEHPVVMDEFMANFETTHFSTYIIAEKVKGGKLEDAAQDVIKNPNTGDNILTYVLLLVLSGLAVGFTSYKFIKREN